MGAQKEITNDKLGNLRSWKNQAKKVKLIDLDNLTFLTVKEGSEQPFSVTLTDRCWFDTVRDTTTILNEIYVELNKVGDTPVKATIINMDHIDWDSRMPKRRLAGLGTRRCDSPVLVRLLREITEAQIKHQQRQNA